MTGFRMFYNFHALQLSVFLFSQSARVCSRCAVRCQTAILEMSAMPLPKLAAVLSVAAVLGVFLCWVWLRVLAFANRCRTRRLHNVAAGATVIGFFHPFCAGGGGGERVLWRAVLALSTLSKDLGKPLHVLIYTGDLSMSPEDILSAVARQFDLSIDPAALSVSFVYVRWRCLLDPNLYPVCTMLAQSVASMVLAAEALFRATPDVFFDTTGFAFSFPVAWLAGCSVGAYVHYPTISMVREEP